MMHGRMHVYVWIFSPLLWVHVLVEEGVKKYKRMHKHCTHIHGRIYTLNICVCVHNASNLLYCGHPFLFFVMWSSDSTRRSSGVTTIMQTHYVWRVRVCLMFSVSPCQVPTYYVHTSQVL